jgi:hypothetical protein
MFLGASFPTAWSSTGLMALRGCDWGFFDRSVLGFWGLLGPSGSYLGLGYVSIAYANAFHRGYASSLPRASHQRCSIAPL